MHGVVEWVERLTPGLIRVYLGGDGLASFEPTSASDAYLNVALPAADAPYEMPCDLTSVRELPRELRPFRRRYTVRSWDPSARLLAVDFVVHGDLGVAGPWAAGATAGEVLQMEGPSGSYAPEPSADWHLLAGDESALPAIAAALEALPASARAVVRLVVDSAADELKLAGPDRMDLLWLHRTGSDTPGDLLASSLRDVTFPPGRVHAFVHGEAEEVRAARRHLLAERVVARSDLSVSPYWRRTMADEAWREVKSAWTADVERDVV